MKSESKERKNMRQRSGLIYFRQKGETSVSGACDRTVRSETQCSDGIANADRGRFVAAATKRVSVTISDSPVTARGRKRAKRAKKYEAEKRPHIFSPKGRDFRQWCL